MRLPVQLQRAMAAEAEAARDARAKVGCGTEYLSQELILIRLVSGAVSALPLKR